jgi:hypothetical protein
MEMVLIPFDTLHIARATCSPAPRSPPARTTWDTPGRAESDVLAKGLIERRLYVRRQL